ncbi:MAG: hypothetical protein AAF270_06910 [Pseudomonadota bacterium]
MNGYRVIAIVLTTALASGAIGYLVRSQQQPTESKHAPTETVADNSVESPIENKSDDASPSFSIESMPLDSRSTDVDSANEPESGSDSGGSDFRHGVFTDAIEIPDDPPYATMRIDDAAALVRQEEKDYEWAQAKEMMLAETIWPEMEKVGTSPSLIECRSRTCLVEWYADPSLREENPRAFLDFTMAIFEAGGTSHVTLDPDDNQRGLLVVTWDAGTDP